jgi:hypothetical protein
MKEELCESQEIKGSKPREGWCRGGNPALLHFSPKESHFGWADCNNQIGVPYAWQPVQQPCNKWNHLEIVVALQRLTGMIKEYATLLRGC